MGGGGVARGDVLIVLRKVCLFKFAYLIAQKIQLILAGGRGKKFFDLGARGAELTPRLGVTAGIDFGALIESGALERFVEKTLVRACAVNVDENPPEIFKRRESCTRIVDPDLSRAGFRKNSADNKLAALANGKTRIGQNGIHLGELLADFEFRLNAGIFFSVTNGRGVRPGAEHQPYSAHNDAFAGTCFTRQNIQTRGEIHFCLFNDGKI